MEKIYLLYYTVETNGEFIEHDKIFSSKKKAFKYVINKCKYNDMFTGNIKFKRMNMDKTYIFIRNAKYVNNAGQRIVYRVIDQRILR